MHHVYPTLKRLPQIILQQYIYLVVFDPGSLPRVIVIKQRYGEVTVIYSLNFSHTSDK